MNLKTLIDKYSWKDIEPRFLEIYPEDTEKFQKYIDVFNQLQGLEVKGEDAKMKILIEQINDEDGESYTDLSGVISNNDIKYGLTQTNWEIWLRMEITFESLSHFGDLDCIVHCLWEMTYDSFTNEDRF